MLNNMDTLKINGHKVVFGKVTRKCWWSGSYTGEGVHHAEKRQHWEIPELELYGHVVIAELEPFVMNYSLDQITRNIQREVNYDLDQRKKKELGIGRR